MYTVKSSSRLLSLPMRPNYIPRSTLQQKRCVNCGLGSWWMVLRLDGGQGPPSLFDRPSKMPKRLDPQGGAGGGWVERGWIPLLCALDISHGVRLPSRAPGIAASNGTAVGKGGERAWLLNGVKRGEHISLHAACDAGWGREFDFGVILPAGKVPAARHGSGCS